MAVKGWKCVRALRGVTHIQIAARVKDRNEPNYSLIAEWFGGRRITSFLPFTCGNVLADRCVTSLWFKRSQCTIINSYNTMGFIIVLETFQNGTHNQTKIEKALRY